MKELKAKNNLGDQNEVYLKVAARENDKVAPWRSVSSAPLNLQSGRWPAEPGGGLP